MHLKAVAYRIKGSRSGAQAIRIPVAGASPRTLAQQLVAGRIS
jgi:hypothetical protein